VGTAGAEGFRPAFSGADVKDAEEDGTIRYKNSETGHSDVDSHHNKNLKFIDIDAGTRELE
jgi:hypothetical protein